MRNRGVEFGVNGVAYTSRDLTVSLFDTLVISIPAPLATHVTVCHD